MQKAALKIITDAAILAGVDKIMDASEADNLTLPRPRLELRFLPISYVRSGRRLALSRQAENLDIKKEVYIAQFDVLAQVFAPNAPNWVDNFESQFMAALPRGINDLQGNWLQIRVRKTTRMQNPTKRVGNSEIKILEKISAIFHLNFSGRISTHEQQPLITDINFIPKFRS